MKNTLQHIVATKHVLTEYFIVKLFFERLSNQQSIISNKTVLRNFKLLQQRNEKKQNFLEQLVGFENENILNYENK